MQMRAKTCRASEPILSFNYENTVTEKTNLKPIEAMCRDERFLSLALK